MTSLSRKFVLMVVLLQLCLSVREVNAGGQFSKPAGTSSDHQEPKFGDILEFTKTGFNHYAVFVGGEKVYGKEPDQNIFEMIRTPEPGCRFHKIDGPFRINNYLDVKGKKPQTMADMIKTIEDLMNKQVCKEYSLKTGNCEHIATKVRYGEAWCTQPGTIVGALNVPGIKTNPKIKRREASAAA